MRALIMSAALVLAARSVSAQDPLTAAKKAAQNAKAKTDAHTEAMQRPEGAQAKTTATAPAPQQTKAAPPPTKASPPQTKSGSASKAGATSEDTKGGAAAPAAPAPDSGQPPPSILREVFDYAQDGRRDPFVSLLTTAELRPTLSDLRLTSIIYVPSGNNSLATMRDVATNTRYTVKVGSTLGRMRVSAIRPLTVLLTIDEFGTTRQDSLILRDSTKVRRP